MSSKKTFLNVEIKASCKNLEKIRQVLNDLNARSVGTDLQTDTYFNVNTGRLKLREGNIENNLIYYDRENKPGPKNSNFQLLKISDPDALKTILTNSMGIKMVVKKVREIYFIDNVKFHLDYLEELGSFVEIEASNLYADFDNEQLLEQCNFYIKEFGILDADMIHDSYSDMMIRLKKSTG